MSRKACWDTVATCIEAMLEMGGFLLVERGECDRDFVYVRGCSFDSREVAYRTFRQMVEFVQSRTPNGMLVRVATVCVDGLLIWTNEPDPEDNDSTVFPDINPGQNQTDIRNNC